MALGSGATTVVGVTIGKTSLGQLSESQKRAESQRLLQQARQAMDAGNFDLAESAIKRAESIGSGNDRLWSRLYDSPAKARRDLQKARQASSGTPTVPGSRFSPTEFLGRERAPQTDPYQSRQHADPAATLTNNGKAEAQTYIKRSREALKAGNSPEAVAWYKKAVAVNTTFSPTEDSPARLASELRQAGVNPAYLVAQSRTAPPLAGSGVRSTADRIPTVPGPNPNRFRQQDPLAAEPGSFAPNTTMQRLPTTRPAEPLRNGRSPVAQAGGTLPAAGTPGANRYPIQQGVYRPDNDPTRVAPVNLQQPTPAVRPLVSVAQRGGTSGQQLYDQGINLLVNGDRKGALQSFQQAYKYQEELDETSRKRLGTYLLQLGSAEVAPRRLDNDNNIVAATREQQALAQQMLSDVHREVNAARLSRDDDPRAGLSRLQEFRSRVAGSELDSEMRRSLLTRVDRGIGELEQFIATNRFQIESDARNEGVRRDIARERQVSLEIHNRLSTLTEDFNQAMDEERFEEAAAFAKQAEDLDPTNPVVVTMMWKQKFASRIITQQAMQRVKEDSVVNSLVSIDQSAIPFDDRDPYRFPEKGEWTDMSARRLKQFRENQGRRMTAVEREIHSRLDTKVQVSFKNMPLAEVIATIGGQAGVNTYLDPQGLAAEGITTDQPVSIELREKISLKSALNVILLEFRLSYVIQDEMLKITSEQTKDTKVYTQVYPVADLVIPIPNFIPSHSMGLPSAIENATRALGLGNQAGGGSGPLAMFAGNDAASPSSTVAAQMGAGGGNSGRSSVPVGFGPGGIGAGAQPDFDSLIELMTSTIAPTTWDEVGGPGSVKAFETNLSLVVSQTQEIHEEIVDLLEQLRRLQDLQVTIEVRFINLSDNFFERIGVDFSFEIQDNIPDHLKSVDADGLAIDVDTDSNSLTVGLGPDGNLTGDFDLQFDQGGFAAAVPAFGGFDVATAANFGFAIISDIEAFFLIQAAQGDTRTNIMQAPKVTLFNGQQAFVSDTSQTPFVTSIIPVVGDFAAAHQPVIVVLSEGTSLSVQAVVSPDRRFVRLTVVPFFSRIGDVETFTFEGSTTTNSGTGATDPDADPNRDNVSSTTTGTTVQLPTFSFVTVTTTVSVPDGGTVLLGGIKRLSEGRSERGVPILSKLPYINRLFRNVGIGRDSQTLMMMVTPRIIIQEEEEEIRGISGF